MSKKRPSMRYDGQLAFWPLQARCGKCGETKPRAEFYGDNRISHGLAMPCKECRRAAASTYYHANVEKGRADRRAYHAANREQANAARKARSDPVAGVARLHAWKRANPDKVRESTRRYRAANPEQTLRFARENDARRRVGRVPESVEYVPVLRSDPCSYCGGSAGHIDHITAVARGGGHGPDNLTAACRSCNSRKNTKPLLLALLEMTCPRSTRA